VKVNRKTRRSALRGVLSQHAADGTLGVLDGSTFTEPSTRAAVALLATWGKELPAVVVTSDEENVAKSFRNIDRVVVTTPGRLEVTALVWARSVLLTQDALELVSAKAANDSKAKAESS
jgi:large subunit ribosomal protein L4